MSHASCFNTLRIQYDVNTIHTYIHTPWAKLIAKQTRHMTKQVTAPNKFKASEKLSCHFALFLKKLILEIVWNQFRGINLFYLVENYLFYYDFTNWSLNLCYFLVFSYKHAAPSTKMILIHKMKLFWGHSVDIKLKYKINKTKHLTLWHWQCTALPWLDTDAAHSALSYEQYQAAWGLRRLGFVRYTHKHAVNINTQSRLSN